MTDQTPDDPPKPKPETPAESTSAQTDAQIAADAASDMNPYDVELTIDVVSGEATDAPSPLPVDSLAAPVELVPRNFHLADNAHPLTGVPFDAKGFPDFSDYRHPDVPDVTIELTGSRRDDEKAANKAAGLTETPIGYTWHHHQEVGLMQLIDRQVHRSTGHTGGFKMGG